METVIDDVFALQSELAARILDTPKAQPKTGPIRSASGPRSAPRRSPRRSNGAELRRTANPDLAILVVAARQLRRRWDNARTLQYIVIKPIAATIGM